MVLKGSEDGIQWTILSGYIYGDGSGGWEVGQVFLWEVKYIQNIDYIATGLREDSIDGKYRVQIS
ncbi:hypothetical protein JCM18750_37500 [Halostagnicola bangensis]